MSSSDREPMLGAATASNINKSFAYKKIRALSISELVLAVLAFVVGVGFIVVTLLSRRYGFSYCSLPQPGYMATGVWCGVLFAATAIVGLKAAKHRTTSLIVTLMVLATTSSAFAGFQLVVSITGAATCSYGYYQWYMLACNIFLAVLGLVQMVLLILSAASACRSTCCDPSPDYMSHIIEPKKQRNDAISQPTPLIPGSQIVYAPSASGSEMKPFLLVPFNQPAMAATMQPPAYPVMMPAPAASAATEQDDQPLIEA